MSGPVLVHTAVDDFLGDKERQALVTSKNHQQEVDDTAAACEPLEMELLHISGGTAYSSKSRGDYERRQGLEPKGIALRAPLSSFVTP